MAGGADHELCRVNSIAFAKARGLSEELVIAGFLHAAQLGVFDLSWNMLCPGCGAVLDMATTLKSVDRRIQLRPLCRRLRTTLDEMVEVAFTVNPRVRRIAAHDPERFPREVFPPDLLRLGGRLPGHFEQLVEEVTVESLDLPPGEKAILALQLPEDF